MTDPLKPTLKGFQEWVENKGEGIVLSPLQLELAGAYLNLHRIAFSAGRAGGKTFLLSLVRQYLDEVR